MKMRQIIKHSAIILTYLCCSSLGLVNNAEQYSLDESSCIPIIPDPSLNMTWFRSVEFWYIPLWSKKELYSWVELSTSPEEFSNITEPELKRTCIMYTQIKETPAKVEFYGLNRKLFDWEASYLSFRDGVTIWAQNGAYELSSFVVLTDNKSYYMGIDEFKDGVREYFVATVSDNVPSAEWEKIYKQIENYGFSKNSTYRLESKCDDDEYIKEIKIRKQ